MIGALRIKYRRDMDSALDDMEAGRGQPYQERRVLAGGLNFRYTNEQPVSDWQPGDEPGEANNYACQICGQPWGH
jgi:hypothetical protein